MRTTRNYYKVPRLLVRISDDYRRSMTEKEILTNTGEKISLCLRAQATQDTEDLTKFEWSIKVGKIVGLSPGCAGYKLGDLAIMDYIVDCDEQYLVEMDGSDKIVSVPCETTFHGEAIYSTTYGSIKKERSRFGGHIQTFNYTGEVNRLVAAPGDVDQLSLVLGVIRQGKLIANDHYLFCRKEPEMSQEMELVDGILAYRNYAETHITRQVLFASPYNQFSPGDTIIALPGSNFDLQIFNQEFDIVPMHDVIAYIEQSTEAVSDPEEASELPGSL